VEKRFGLNQLNRKQIKKQYYNFRGQMICALRAESGNSLGVFMKFKQVIIARKDLNMTPGKLAAQVAHASSAFLARWVKMNTCLDEWGKSIIEQDGQYFIDGRFSKGIWEGWLNDTFTKTVVEAKNKNQLMKAVLWAQEQGMHEGVDYFLVKDNCLTELTPEEVDEDGAGRTLTCIGFRPLPEDLANELSHKFHLYI